MFKKITCILLAIVMLSLPLALPVSAEDELKFSDVPEDHWAYEYINECVSRGILNGYPDGTFKPEKQLKVCEFIKMLVCAYFKNVEEGIESLNLPDGSHWARPYVLIGDRDFFSATDYETDESIERTITRMEATEMVVCLYGLRNYGDKIKSSLDITDEYIKDLKDLDLLESEWDKFFVNTAIKFGLMCGFDDGTFRPFDGLTRAQAAKIIYLALTN